MGGRVSRTDFEWTDKEVVHQERSAKILEKYPHVKKLFGYDPNFKWQVSALVIAQVLILFFIQNQNWWTIVLLAYVVGGTINHALCLAIHDIGHNMAFGHSKPLYNRYFGMFANLPIGVPMSISFKRYHNDHHRAIDTYDPDLPTYLEAQLFCTSFGKFIWVLLQPFFYAFRPFIVRPKAPSNLEIVNLFVQLIFDYSVLHFFGPRALVYLLGGTLLGLSIHPMAGHFISEHYMFKRGYETYSYYGILNYVAFNVGYHNEHHDFPAIPSSKLPELKKIASDFYDKLPQHNSWTKVLYDFVMDPAIGPYARMKRRAVGLNR